MLETLDAIFMGFFEIFAWAFVIVFLGVIFLPIIDDMGGPFRAFLALGGGMAYLYGVIWVATNFGTGWIWVLVLGPVLVTLWIAMRMGE